MAQCLFLCLYPRGILEKKKMLFLMESLIKSNNDRAFGSGMTNVKYFSDAMAASKRIREVIKRVPAIDSNNMEGEIIQQVYGEVTFKNVKFAYPSRPESLVFKDLNLKVPEGRQWRWWRFYDPQGGEICIDGVRIDNLQLKWLRSQLGLVSQEPTLFSTTIKENIFIWQRRCVHGRSH
ncbi:putative P-loop containing nucleoside triphosphate hydrolase [Helianthus anomalus]